MIGRKQCRNIGIRDQLILLLHMPLPYNNLNHQVLRDVPVDPPGQILHPLLLRNVPAHVVPRHSEQVVRHCAVDLDVSEFVVRLAEEKRALVGDDLPGFYELEVEREAISWDLDEEQLVLTLASLAQRFLQRC